MKFTCTKENLSHALDVAGGVGGKINNLPILMNVLIQVSDAKVELLATNLEIAVKTTLRAKVASIGSFTVPVKTLGDFIRLLNNDQIEVELSGNELLITCGNSSTKIKGAPADEYPVIPPIEEAHGYTILVEPLRESLSKVVIAAAKNEIRPELSGVFMSFFGERYKGLILAATDSYRLAEKKVSVSQGEDQMQCIVPARTILEMIRLLSLGKAESGETQARLWLSDNQIALRYDSFEMSSRLVEGRYPDYAQIIPTQFKTIASFPVDVMINKIKAASIFTTIGVNAVHFDFRTADKTIGVSSTSSQTGEHSARIEGDVTGEENTILLNHRYVLDGLQHMSDAPEVELRVNSADAPCLFQEKNKDTYLYIVMPVRQ